MAAAARQVQSVRRILIVDDDPAICELLVDLFDDAGFDAHCVTSDRAAYSVLSSPRAFAGVVVDVNLGEGTTGFDVARFARQMNPGVPVLYVSGQATEASFKAFGVPGSAFVSKPFQPDELLQRLVDLVES